MTHYIGATGLDIFDDIIEETTLTLTNLINAVAIQDNLNAIYSSNYSDKVGVWGSNYSDLIGLYSSNYSDKVGVWGSNYTDREITYTSNYVKITSNILVERTKQLEDRVDDLEGTEGSAGDPDADPPIPPIPPTGNFAILATLGALTAGASALAIVVADLTDDVNDLDDKVDLQALYCSNYSDKIGIFGSNYSDKIGVWGSNYARDKIGIYSSNYTDLVGVWGSNYARDKIGIYSSNYTDLVGVWGSNYARDKIGIYSSNYTDLVSIYSSNYARDKIGIYSSNYTDLVSIYSSNYARDKIGIYSSNYSDKVGQWGSNYSDKIGIYSSNYTDLVSIYSSNYARDKIGIYSSNYTDLVAQWGSNYARDKVGIWGSNYTERLIAEIPSYTNYWTTSGTNDIYLNQAGSVGIGTNTPQNKLHIYNATSSTLRLETNTTGTASVIFQRGATNDIRTDYRIINDADILKFQYQDNLINFGATGSDIMWVYDKRTEFIKDGYFKGTMGIGMLPNANALSITGDTYMEGSLGINTSAGSYPLDVYGNVNIDGDVGIGANPLAGVKLYVSGATRLGGSVGIGVAPTSYAFDIIGSSRFDGYVGIGTIPSSSTYRLDILGNFRTQGGIVSTGIIQAGNGLTASGGLITASAGISSTTLTASGLITANAGITIPAGQTLTSTGTTILTGNVGIGTTSHATYKVNVNGTLNATTLLMGGNPISGSKWTTATDTTEIYYNSGNVGIGTTDPLCKLQIGIASQVSPFITGTFILASHGDTFINNILAFGIPYRESGANFPCNKINLYKVAGYGHGIGLSTDGVEYFTGGPYSSGNHVFYTGATDTSFGTARLKISSNGNIGIGNTNPAYKLHVRCSYGVITSGLHLDAGETDTATDKYTLTIYPFVIAGGEVGWRFRTQNFTGGTHTPLTLNNYGDVAIARNLSAGGAIYTDNSYMLAKEVYARNSYDTRIRSDSGGMYLEMGYIGSAGGLLKIGAYNSVTNIDSGESRNIIMRTGGGVWVYTPYNGSFNAAGSIYWTNPSDHRIKENIKKANLKMCYDNIKNINLYRFNYIDGYKKATQYDRTQLGFIAQQVKQHYPKSIRREKMRFEDKREVPDLSVIDVAQVNYSLFGAVKQLIRVVEKQSKRIKKLEEMLNIIDDDEVEDDADEPYIRINCEDEVDIDDIEPSEPTEV